MKLGPKSVLAVCLVTAGITYALMRAPSPSPAPPDRPVLTVIARLAKTLLWMAFFADPPPDECQQVQGAYGTDGYPMVDHGRSL